LRLEFLAAGSIQKRLGHLAAGAVAGTEHQHDRPGHVAPDFLEMRHRRRQSTPAPPMPRSAYGFGQQGQGHSQSGGHSHPSQQLQA